MVTTLVVLVGVVAVGGAIVAVAMSVHREPYDCPHCGHSALFRVDKQCQYLIEIEGWVGPWRPARGLYECTRCRAQLANVGSQWICRTNWPYEMDRLIWDSPRPRVLVVYYAERAGYYLITNRATGHWAQAGGQWADVPEDPLVRAAIDHAARAAGRLRYGGIDAFTEGVAASLAKWLGTLGEAPVREADRLFLASVGLALGCSTEYCRRLDQGVVVSIRVLALHGMEFPGGIQHTIVAGGEFPQEAVDRAARAWTDGVFPVYRRLLAAGASEASARRFELLAEDLQSGGSRAWQAYVGPLQVVSGAWLWPEKIRTRPGETAVFDALLADLADVLAEQRLHWVGCLAGRLPEGSIEADCRLDEHDWPAGRKTLRRVVRERAKGAGYRGYRQFFLLRPCGQNDLRRPEELEQALLSRRRTVDGKRMRVAIVELN